MAEHAFFDEHAPKLVAALVLTFSSGLVDIVGYLGVFHLFAGHLTGTTAQLGHSLIARDWVGVSAAAVIVGAFVAGSILGRTLIEIGSRRRIRKIASVTLAIEAIILAVVAVKGGVFSHQPYLSLAALAAAMGIQTATLTGVGPLTVHTTFVTGMLNKTAQLVSRIGFRGYDLLKSKSRSAAAQRDQEQDIQMTVFLVAIWLFYVAGAAVGTWSFESWGLRALLLGVGLLAVAFAIDQFCSLSIQEEKEQSER